MIYTNSRAESIELSRSICKAINKNLDSKILGIKGARFEVLREIRMPGVLIESGFLSNLNEENMLKNSYYRQKIAQAVSQGILEYAKGARIMEVSSR
jgi:N-acetylmuramoyl-L-alanine amidase